MTLPNFLIVGAAKAGTTALYQYLRQHPAVFMPASIKEAFFFSGLTQASFSGKAAIYAKDAISSLEDYEALFQDAQPGMAIGEACVAYLYYHEDVIPKIKAMLGSDCKIIISLRNPVDRAFSGYMHHLKDGFEPVSFEEALSLEDARQRQGEWWGYQYRKTGLYADQVSAYIEAFGRDNVKVVFAEALSKDPQKVMREIYAMLGVDVNFVSNTALRFNTSGKPKYWFSRYLFQYPAFVRRAAHLLMSESMRRSLQRSPTMVWLKNINLAKPSMCPKTRNALLDYYREDIQKLERCVGMDLSDWLK